MSMPVSATWLTRSASMVPPSPTPKPTSLDVASPSVGPVVAQYTMLPPGVTGAISNVPWVRVGVRRLSSRAR